MVQMPKVLGTGVLLAVVLPTATAKTLVRSSEIPSTACRSGHEAARTEVELLPGRGVMRWTSAAPMVLVRRDPLRIAAMFSSHVGLGNS